MGLALRLRTTSKEVNTEAMQTIAQDYRLSIEHIFKNYGNIIKIYNADELAVYLDAPGNTTIDEVGAHTVEIGTTKHEKDRVSVLLCVSSDGLILSALVIHASTSKKLRNTVREIAVTYGDDDTEEQPRCSSHTILRHTSTVK